MTNRQIILIYIILNIATYENLMALSNQKHEKFCRKMANIDSKKSPTQAYLEVFQTNNKATAQVSASKLLNSWQIKERISELLDMQDLSLARCNDKLAQFFTAQKGILVNKELVDVNDNGTQLEALKTAYKLHGLLGSSTNVNINNGTVNNNTINIDSNKVNEILERMSTVNAKMGFADAPDGEVTDADVIIDD